jgi:hypothetical protein
MLALCHSGSKIYCIVEDEADLCEYFECIEKYKNPGGLKTGPVIEIFWAKARLQ